MARSPDSGTMSILAIVGIGFLAVAYPLWDSGEKGAAVAIGIVGFVAEILDYLNRRRAKSAARNHTQA